MAAGDFLFYLRANRSVTVDETSSGGGVYHHAMTTSISGSGGLYKQAASETLGSTASQTFEAPETSGLYMLDGWYVPSALKDLSDYSVSDFTNWVSSSASVSGSRIKGYMPSPNGAAGGWAYCVCVKYVRGYTVTFKDGVDGSTISTVRVKSGERVPSSQVPTAPDHRPYYDFVRWDGDYMTVTSDRTVTAVYSGVSVTVYLYSDFGDIPGSDYDRSLRYGGTYGADGGLPTPTREGYSFSGWFTALDGGTQVTDSTVVTRTDSHSIYAHWVKGVTVLFDAGGVPVSPAYMFVYPGGTYGQGTAPDPLPVPARSGRTFTGWYTAPSGGVQVTAATVVAIEQTHTLYARWSVDPVSVTVTFDANGGSLSGQASKTVTYGSAYGTLSTASRTGYSLSGWYTASAGGSAVTSSTVVSSTVPHVLYAQWTGDPLTVSFNANGGSVGVQSKTVSRGNCYGSLPLAAWADTTKVFDFWSLDQDGMYPVSPSDRPSASVTLYAQWKSSVQSVSYAVLMV